MPIKGSDFQQNWSYIILTKEKIKGLLGENDFLKSTFQVSFQNSQLISSLILPIDIII